MYILILYAFGIMDVDILNKFYFNLPQNCEPNKKEEYSSKPYGNWKNPTYRAKMDTKIKIYKVVKILKDLENYRCKKPAKEENINAHACYCPYNKHGIYVTRYEEELQKAEACLQTYYNHI
jgi:hypothetical protein